MEYHRDGRAINTWEPFVWEYSSGIVILCLIPLILRLDSVFPIRQTHWKKSLLAHGLATIPFSMLHVASMVGLRKWIYGLNQKTYEFGDIFYEFLYEYRKDFFTYFFILTVIYAYRFYRAKTTGATYDEQGPDETSFLVKKNGVLLQIGRSQVNWVEAAGNYALLHTDSGVHPLRDTMKDLNERLGDTFLRIHRSSIVNVDQVASTQNSRGNWWVILKNGEKLKCSRSARPQIQQVLQA